MAIIRIMISEREVASPANCRLAKSRLQDTGLKLLPLGPVHSLSLSERFESYFIYTPPLNAILLSLSLFYSFPRKRNFYIYRLNTVAVIACSGAKSSIHCCWCGESFNFVLGELARRLFHFNYICNELRGACDAAGGLESVALAVLAVLIIVLRIIVMRLLCEDLGSVIFGRILPSATRLCIYARKARACV